MSEPNPANASVKNQPIIETHQYITENDRIVNSAVPVAERLVQVDIWFNEPRQPSEISPIVTERLYKHYNKDDSLKVSHNNTKSIEKLAKHILTSGLAANVEMMPVSSMKWNYTYLPMEQVTRIEIRDQYRVQFAVDPRKDQIKKIDKILYEGMYAAQSELTRDETSPNAPNLAWSYKVIDRPIYYVCSFAYKKNSETA